MDTILVKKGQTFVSNNHSTTFIVDTILILPSTQTYEIKPSKSEIFFNRLAQTANKRSWTHELHNIVITSPNKTKVIDSLNASASVLPYVFCLGLPIRRIVIKQLDVFGPTITDTSRYAVSWLEQTGNKLHIKTKERLIRNALLFKEGDFIDPLVLADNERVLRGLPYLEDARIIIKPSSISNDSADVLVMVKDVWPIAFNVNIESVYTGNFDFWDRNILGLGHEIQSSILWDTHQTSRLGIHNGYMINNISRSFISGKIYYDNIFHNESYGVLLERNFFTPNIKYAGGLSFENIQTLAPLKIDTSTIKYAIRYNNLDFWVGRSFRINNNGFTKIRQNFTITGRIVRDQFFERPKITENSFYNYQDKTLLLGSVSYSSHSYFKSNFIYNFGRTEDIPIGSEITFIFGKEINEFTNRSYLATQLSFGTFIGNIGYFYTNFNFGSFFLNKNKLEQGIISSQLNYYSPLLIIKKYKFRQFVNVNYTKGINRFSKEYLIINNNYGLSGFTNDSIYGNERLNMHWETVCFTPWDIYDFHVVFFLFADHSWLVRNSTKLLSKFPYTALGFGIRIRNERLVFNTIQIGFNVYPNIPSGSQTRTLEISGEPLLNSPNFLPQSPKLVNYQ